LFYRSEKGRKRKREREREREGETMLTTEVNRSNNTFRQIFSKPLCRGRAISGD
jgi:hypothetical protein